MASERLPKHAQVAVVLNGSINGVKARREGALRLLQNEIIDYLMFSVPEVGYWDEPVPDLARRYIESQFGAAVSQRVTFCGTGENVDSTAEEAMVLRDCLEKRGWRSVIVVTSSYHTRRAGIIWRATLAKEDPPFTLSLYGVADADFASQGWWRKRRYAKTWLLEMAKLVWTSLFERTHG